MVIQVLSKSQKHITQQPDSNSQVNIVTLTIGKILVKVFLNLSVSYKLSKRPNSFLWQSQVLNPTLK
jgi:hypothetical protein